MLFPVGSYVFIFYLSNIKQKLCIYSFIYDRKYILKFVQFVISPEMDILTLDFVLILVKGRHHKPLVQNV